MLQKPRVTRSSVISTAVITFLAIATQATAQSTGAYSLADLKQMITGGMRSVRILDMASKECIDFESNDRNETALREAGADVVLIEGLRKTCRPESAGSAASASRGNEPSLEETKNFLENFLPEHSHIHMAFAVMDAKMDVKSCILDLYWTTYRPMFKPALGEMRIDLRRVDPTSVKVQTDEDGRALVRLATTSGQRSIVEMSGDETSKNKGNNFKFTDTTYSGEQQLNFSLAHYGNKFEIDRSPARLENADRAAKALRQAAKLCGGKSGPF